jgi:hypothetical protein
MKTLPSATVGLASYGAPVLNAHRWVNDDAVAGVIAVCEAL